MKTLNVLMLLASILIFGCETTDENVVNSSILPIPESKPKKDGYTMKVIQRNLPSPRKEMTGYLNGKKVIVNYGSPKVNDRKVFGGLLPYGKLWRTGANEATTITFESSMAIASQRDSIQAGIYAIFTIPGKNTFEFILNEDPDQWNTMDYEAEKDILRNTVTVKQLDQMQEELEFKIEDGKLWMVWEKVAMPIDLT